MAPRARFFLGLEVPFEAEQALQEAKLLRAEKRQQSLAQAFNAAQNDVADAAIARFFYKYL